MCFCFASSDLLPPCERRPFDSFSDGRTGRLIASASVDIHRLDVYAPVGPDQVVKLASRAGGSLGTVRVGVALDYHPGAVSSFEMNEHLAKTDDTLPLAPLPSPRPDGMGRAVKRSPERAAGRMDGAWWYAGPATPARMGGTPAGRGGGPDADAADDGSGSAAATPGDRRVRDVAATGRDGRTAVASSDAGGRGKTPTGAEKEKENLAGVTGAAVRAFGSKQQQHQRRRGLHQRGGDAARTTNTAATPNRRSRAALTTTPKPSKEHLERQKKEAAARTPNGVLEHAERLRGEMDKALSEDPAVTSRIDPPVDGADPILDGLSTASSEGRWWGDVGASRDWRREATVNRSGGRLRSSAGTMSVDGASGTSTCGASQYGEEEGDAAFAADEALLEELFFVDGDGEGFEGFELITGPGARRRGVGSNSGGDADDGGVRASVAAGIGRLALEAEAELERDMAAAEASTSREGLDRLSWRRYQTRGAEDDEYDDDEWNDDEDDDMELSDSERASTGGGGRRGPLLELRLTAHAGLIAASDPSVAAEDRQPGARRQPRSLVAVLKAGFAQGELGRVVLDGPRASGSARVRLPETAAAAAVMGHHIVVVLELWAPEAAADASGRTGRASLDAGDEIFSQLFGDFTAADPSLMHGVVAVPLTDLGKELEMSESRREGRGEDGVVAAVTGNCAPEDGARVLNKVFEVRNPVLGGTGGCIGVEGRLVE